MNFQRGSVFIESMIAMAVIVIALIGAITLLSNSIGFTRVVADQHIAAGLAAEGIEIVKNKIDADVFCGGGSFSGFSIGNVDHNGVLASPQNQPLYFNDDDGYVYTTPDSEPTRFIRTITVSHVSDHELKVNSVVAWISRAGSFDVNVEDHFFDWVLAGERGALAGCL